jgi:hypothetical protein
MGFHCIYDNADIRECKWMIAEIQDYLKWIIDEARIRTYRNNKRRIRREAHETDVSDDESIDSGYNESEEEESE